MNLEIQYTTPAAAEIYGRSSNYGSADAAGFDLRAMIDQSVTILPGEQALIPTGIKLNMGPMLQNDSMRYAAMAIPRSGRGSKEGLVLANTIGLVDQDYLGEIMLCCWARPTDGSVKAATNRLCGSPIFIEPLERIAQLVIVPVMRPHFIVVANFSASTQRGVDGFGSTGKS